MENINESELIARLIASTKRKKRNFSIVEIADDIVRLKKLYTGNLKKVAATLGLSVGMLNQFLSVFKLPEEIKKLVHERKIDSVALVFLLSKLSREDILGLHTEIMSGNLNSQELKILLPFRKQHPDQNITELLQQVHASKNIKVSVMQFPKNVVQKTQNNLSEIIKTLIGEENFVTIDSDEKLFYIKIKKSGEKILRNIAKDKKMSLSDLMITLIK